MPDIKSIRHDSDYAFNYLVEYAMTGDRSHEPELHQNYYHNLYSTSMDGIVAEFEQNDIHRSSRAKTKAYHEIVSFHPDDPVTREDLFKMAEKYIEIRGATNAQVLVSLHTDTPHKHIHCVIGGVELRNSKALFLDNRDYKRIRIDFERWVAQEFSHIQYSYTYAPELKQQKLQLLSQEQNLSTAQSIQKHVLDAFEQVKSLQDLEQLIGQHQDLEVYYRDDRKKNAYGVLINGKKVRWRKLGVKIAFDEWYLSLEHKKELDRVDLLKRAWESNRGREDGFSPEIEY